MLVLGDPTRFAHHGLKKSIRATADPATGLERGRINITMRATGICQVFLPAAASQER
jgi:alkylated DNA repair protein (DNA oxidative demethylase)